MVRVIFDMEIWKAGTETRLRGVGEMSSKGSAWSRVDRRVSRPNLEVARVGIDSRLYSSFRVFLSNSHCFVFDLVHIKYRMMNLYQ